MTIQLPLEAWAADRAVPIEELATAMDAEATGAADLSKAKVKPTLTYSLAARNRNKNVAQNAPQRVDAHHDTPLRSSNTRLRFHS